MLPYIKKQKIFYYILFTFLFTCSISMAAQFESSDHVHISNIHVIEGDLYAWGEKVTIDGEIKGDFIGGGENVAINGYIDNSANIFSNRFSESGEIDGSLRLFVNDASVDGIVNRSGLFFCNSLNIGKNAVFGEDVDFRGGNINLDGTVHGDVTIYSGSSVSFGSGVTVNKSGVYISGTIDGDVTVYGKNIHIVAPALIKGDLKYVSENQAFIDINSGVTILGNTTWDLPEKAEEDTGDSFFLAATMSGSKFMAALLFGLLLIIIGKKYITSMVDELQSRVTISAAVGFISLAVIVIFVILLLLALVFLITGLALVSKGEAVGGSFILVLSTIMIPISSITLVTLSSMIYSGQIIVALLLGYLLMKRFKANPTFLSKSQLFVGLLLLYLLYEIPYIGFLLYIITTLIGTGAIILGIKNCHKELQNVENKNQVGV